MAYSQKILKILKESVKTSRGTKAYKIIFIGFNDEK